MSKSVHVMLAERYADAGWAYFTEVHNDLGAAHQRTRADALAFSVWQSRGFELHGHEIKSSRNDLLRELKDPAKAESIAQYCDRWWLVVSDKELIKDVTEIPPTWGILAPKGGILRAARPAKKLSPKPWPRGFIAAVLRQGAETHVSMRHHNEVIQNLQAERDALVEKEIERRMLTKRAEAERERDALQRRLDGLEAALKTFQDRTGINIQSDSFGYRAGEHAAKVGELAHHLAIQGNDLGALASRLEEASVLARAAATQVKPTTAVCERCGRREEMYKLFKVHSGSFWCLDTGSCASERGKREETTEP